MNLATGSIGRISLRWILISVAASIGLGVFYNHYDYWRDPKFTASLVAFGGLFDGVMKYLWPDDRDEQIKRLKAKCGES